MNRIDELREQIDACRTGSDDLHLPELAGLAQAVEQDRAVAAELDRSQQFDRHLISALHDVPVPAGLLERLLERLLDKTAEAESAATTDSTAILAAAVDRAVSEAVAHPIDGSPVVATAITMPARRRWFLRAGSLAVVTAAIAVVAVVWSRQTPRTITQEQLAADVPAWIDEAKATNQWQTKPPESVLSGYPVDSLRTPPVRTPPVRWRSFRTARGEAGVVYDVTPQGGGGRVLLFVVPTANAYAVATTPYTAIPGMTGGVSVGAWQRSTGLLYVLVVERGNRLEAYLRVAPLG